MIIVTYIVSIITFYFAYLISTAILGLVFIMLKSAILKREVQLEGMTLLYVSSLSIQLSFTSVLFVFYLFGFVVNWFVITPILLYVWYKISPTLYRPYFESGGAHWGVLLGLISFFYFIHTFIIF